MHVLNVQGMSGCQTYSNNIALTIVIEYTETRYVMVFVTV